MTDADLPPRQLTPVKLPSDPESAGFVCAVASPVCVSRGKKMTCINCDGLPHDGFFPCCGRCWLCGHADAKVARKFDKKPPMQGGAPAIPAGDHKGAAAPLISEASAPLTDREQRGQDAMLRALGFASIDELAASCKGLPEGANE